MKSKDIKGIDIQELDKVSGGAIWFNKYDESEYHEAGLNTYYRNFRTDMFYFCMPGGFSRHLMEHDEANVYVQYFKEHSQEEYIKKVQEVVPDYTCVIKGRSLYN